MSVSSNSEENTKSRTKNLGARYSTYRTSSEIGLPRRELHLLEQIIKNTHQMSRAYDPRIGYALAASAYGELALVPILASERGAHRSAVGGGARPRNDSRRGIRHRFIPA